MVTPAKAAKVATGALTLRILGPLAVVRGGTRLALPPSRKVRALLAYLVVAPHPVSRTRLCELLGDIPNDPKSELRWCLSKLRALVDAPGSGRVMSSQDLISLDLEGCDVDVLRIEAALKDGLETLDVQTLRDLCGLFEGDFLEGLDLNRSPQLDHWVTAQRIRFHVCRAAMLERVIERLQDNCSEARRYAERWVDLSPLDARAHILLLKTSLECGLTAEANQHFAAAERLFEHEVADLASIRRAWHAMRTGMATPTPAAMVQTIQSVSTPGTTAGVGSAATRRASLAITPFVEPQSDGQGRLAEGLTHDIITRLAKLRSLFVIARGSVFALAEQGIGPEDAARRLDVDYFTTGMVKRDADRVLVSIELAEARTARIVWSEEFDLRSDEAFLVLGNIGDMIVAAIASEIETAEKNRAILKPPNSLNAWEAYHRGLWHMYRFTKADNDLAHDLFRRSSEIDPTFARAFAGLSFTLAECVPAMG